MFSVQNSRWQNLDKVKKRPYMPLSIILSMIKPVYKTDMLSDIIKFYQMLHMEHLIKVSNTI